MINLKSFWHAAFSLSAVIKDWLLLSSGFSCFLLLIRMIVTGSIEYIFLPWNLFLAFIPYGITWWMARNIALIENKIKLLAALAVWLLFIPNSFYIITDLFHLIHVRSAPKWFDLLLIFSFAWNGILFGILSIRRLELVLSLQQGKGFSFLWVFIVMWLCSFGIYIGRFLRFNSWDVITDPFSLAGEIMDMVIHPFAYSYAWGMTLCYAAFMTLLYFTIKKISESFNMEK